MKDVLGFIGMVLTIMSTIIVAASVGILVLDWVVNGDMRSDPKVWSALYRAWLLAGGGYLLASFVFLAWRVTPE